MPVQFLKAINYKVPQKRERLILVGIRKDIEVEYEYMGKSFYLGGGKTGMPRRIGWDEPSLTLTFSLTQKQTERCHPDETRPFTVRKYARIQTFPDDWKFAGSISQQYKQIGNAVPCNLGKEPGYSIINFLNKVYSKSNKSESSILSVNSISIPFISVP